MDSALINNLNFVCLRPKNDPAYKKSSAADISRTIINAFTELQAELTESTLFSFEITPDADYQSDSNYITGFKIINKNNKTDVRFNIFSSDKQKMNMLKTVCDSGSTLELTSNEEKNSFNEIIKACIQKLHSSSNSTFSYSTPLEAITENFEAALSNGLCANYAIIKQPDKSSGLTIQSLDSENIELQANSHPLKNDDQTNTTDVKVALAQEEYTKNVFSALMSTALAD